MIIIRKIDSLYSELASVHIVVDGWYMSVANIRLRETQQKTSLHKKNYEMDTAVSLREPRLRLRPNAGAVLINGSAQ